MNAVLELERPTVTPEQMAAAGLRAFSRMAVAWGLSVD